MHPDGLVPVQRAIDEIDATVPVSVQTLRSATSLEMNMRRLGTILMAAMGGVGLLLAMVGLYGGRELSRCSPHGGNRYSHGARCVAPANSSRDADASLDGGLTRRGARSAGITRPHTALQNLLAGVSPFDLWHSLAPRCPSPWSALPPATCRRGAARARSDARAATALTAAISTVLFEKDSGRILDTDRTWSSGGDPRTVGEVTAAIAHDTTVFDLTGSLLGSRYRFEIASRVARPTRTGLC